MYMTEMKTAARRGAQMGAAAAVVMGVALSGPQAVSYATTDGTDSAAAGPAAPSATSTAARRQPTRPNGAPKSAAAAHSSAANTSAPKALAAGVPAPPPPASASPVVLMPSVLAAAPSPVDSPSGSGHTSTALPVAATTSPVAPVVTAAAAGSLSAATSIPMAPQASPAATLLGLSTGPLGEVLQAAAVQVLGESQSRRVATASATLRTAKTVSAAAALPITVGTANSFTTLYGTTAAGSVTLNGHTWVADPTTHLYTTTTDLAQEWRTYYGQMKAGQGSSLNNVQRLEGNAEAVFENTGLKSLSAQQLSTDRQDVQRSFDAMYAAMVGAGVNLNGSLTQQQYLSVENVLQGNPTLLELGVQGHGLNNSGIARYNGYTKDFQNGVDGQTLYVGGGLNNGQRVLNRFFDDNILTHMPFPTAVNNGVLWQLNQNGNRENTVADAVTALNSGMSTTYTSKDFLQPPQLVNKTTRQVFTNGQVFSFALAPNTFVDLQGQALTYVATLANGAALPTWVSFDTQTAQFSGTPPAGTTSSVVFVTATNSSGLHTTEAFQVQFKEPAPVLVNRTPTQKVTASAFSFAVAPNTFADPLGQTLTYTATLQGGAALPGWLVFNAQTGQFSGTAPAGTKSVGIAVTATNSSGVKTSEVFAVQFTR